jgi:hypothetical protein
MPQSHSLYSLRHFYAVTALRNGIGVFEVARNMGTSVQMIQQYYGKQATPAVFALGSGIDLPLPNLALRWKSTSGRVIALGVRDACRTTIIEAPPFWPIRVMYTICCYSPVGTVRI